jgi:hypothetical protein
MDEMAPWAKSKSSSSSASPSKAGKIVAQPGGIGAYLNAIAPAAAKCVLDEVVTERRLDQLHDAWLKVDCPKGNTDCTCIACVTMDILQMTHVIGKSEFDTQIRKVAGLINALGGSWGMGSLQPGKSNFWLSLQLLNCSELTTKPACFCTTQVNDTKQWVAFDVEVRGELTAKSFLIVVDDVSYSGTQLCNLLERYAQAFPTMNIVACPLFLTQHAEQKIRAIKARNVRLWGEFGKMPANDYMFATLGDHRHTSARSFDALMQLYAGGTSYSDARWLEADKKLTTCIPYYKIPDHLSCPEKAYLCMIPSTRQGISPEARQEIDRLKFTAANDQNPAYKKLQVLTKKAGTGVGK